MNHPEFSNMENSGFLFSHLPQSSSFLATAKPQRGDIIVVPKQNPTPSPVRGDIIVTPKGIGHRLPTLF